MVNDLKWCGCTVDVSNTVWTVDKKLVKECDGCLAGLYTLPWLDYFPQAKVLSVAPIAIYDNICGCSAEVSVTSVRDVAASDLIYLIFLYECSTCKAVWDKEDS